MSEIKPVYQVRQLGEWIEVDKNIFDELYIQNKFPHRILYPAAAYEALQARVKELEYFLKIRGGDIEQMRIEHADELKSLKAENAAQANEIKSLRKQVEELKLAHQYQVNLNLKNG